MINKILYIIIGLAWSVLGANIIFIHHPTLGKYAAIICIVLYIVLNITDPDIRNKIFRREY